MTLAIVVVALGATICLALVLLDIVCAWAALDMISHQPADEGDDDEAEIL